MSQLQLNQPSLRVAGTNRPMFEKAPVEVGRKRGYFKDEVTRVLLSLTKEDYLQVSGTYGAKELAEYPVDFTLLRNGSYDQRLLPFVPKRRATMRPVWIELRHTNHQWKPSARALKGLEEDLRQAIAQAEDVAARTQLPLPDYAYELVPRLCYRDDPDAPLFEYQFQLWFDAEAHYIRWRRAERVSGLLDGYTNVSRLLLEPTKEEWACGEPIGIDLDTANVDIQDRDLAIAYAFLRVPINLPSNWKIPSQYSLRDAQAALLSEGRGSVLGHLTFPVLEQLPGDDYDALVFSDVRPNFPSHRYSADGMRLTKQQRKDQAEEISSDMYENEGSGSEPVENAPSGKITEVMEDIQPTGTLVLRSFHPVRLDSPEPPSSSRGPALRLDTVSDLVPLIPTSNPASASTSAPASAVSSAFSSASSSFQAPAQPWREPATRQGRTARRKHRAREYPGSSRPPQRTEASRETWNQYFESREDRSTAYNRRNDTTQASSSALAPRTSATNIGPVRSTPQLRVLNMQAQPMLLHDTASNQLVETTILSTDFSRSAVLQNALQQQQQPSRRSERSPSRERDRSPPRGQGSRNRSRDRRRSYQQRSPSPSHRRRSPPAPRRRSPARYRRDQLSPPRERYPKSRRSSPVRERAREPTRESWPEQSSFDQRREGQPREPNQEFAYAPSPPGNDNSQGWGASSPLYSGPSDKGKQPANPSTSRGK